jgi:hypothetical protein
LKDRIAGFSIAVINQLKFNISNIFIARIKLDRLPPLYEESLLLLIPSSSQPLSFCPARLSSPSPIALLLHLVLPHGIFVFGLSDPYHAFKNSIIISLPNLIVDGKGGD